MPAVSECRYSPVRWEHEGKVVMEGLLLLLLRIVLVVCALALTVLVVLQDNRGGGLAGVLAGYGGESAFGTETVSKVKKLTAYLGVLLFVVLLALAIFGERSGRIMDERDQEAPVEESASSTPEAPAAAPSAPAEPAPETAP